MRRSYKGPSTNGQATRGPGPMRRRTPGALQRGVAGTPGRLEDRPHRRLLRHSIRTVGRDPRTAARHGSVVVPELVNLFEADCFSNHCAEITISSGV